MAKILGNYRKNHIISHMFIFTHFFSTMQWADCLYSFILVKIHFNYPHSTIILNTVNITFFLPSLTTWFASPEFWTIFIFIEFSMKFKKIIPLLFANGPLHKVNICYAHEIHIEFKFKFILNLIRRLSITWIVWSIRFVYSFVCIICFYFGTSSLQSI